MSWKHSTLSEISECMPTTYGDNIGENEHDLPVVKVSNVSSEGRLKLPLDKRSFSEKNLNQYLSQQGELLVVKSSGSKAKVLSGKTALVDQSLSGKIRHPISASEYALQ